MHTEGSGDAPYLEQTEWPAIEYAFGEADAPNLAVLHREAFPEFFLSSLGEEFLIQFYLGFVDDPSAIVAVQRDLRGTPRGVAVGTTDAQGFYSRLLKRRFWGFVRASAIAALRNPRVAPRLLRAVAYRGGSTPPTGSALLSSICVDSHARRRGMGRAILLRWRQRAHACGASSAYLTTDAQTNDRVNEFYQRDGWALDQTFFTREGREMNQYVIDLRPDAPERSGRSV